MNRFVLLLTLSFLLVSGYASADSNARLDRSRIQPSKGRAVPELSIGGAGSAFVLLAGAALIVAGRRKRKI